MHHAITLSELFNGVLVGGGLMFFAYVGLRYLAAASSGVYR